MSPMSSNISELNINVWTHGCMSRWFSHTAKRYQRELNEPHTPGSRGRMHHHHHHVSCGWLLQRVVARRPLHNHKREWKKVWRKIAHNFFPPVTFYCCFDPRRLYLFIFSRFYVVVRVRDEIFQPSILWECWCWHFIHRGLCNARLRTVKGIMPCWEDYI